MGIGRALIYAGVLFLLLILAGPLLAVLGFGIMGGMMVFGMFFWVIGLFALFWLLLRDRRGTEGRDAMELLKERYARGEISRKEYLSMKKDLRG